MRLKQILCTLLISLALFTACSKDEQAPEPLPQSTQNLIGMGTRSWKIQELYINGIAQTLTATQKNYSKFYRVADGKTISGKVSSTDGYTGDWVFLSAQSLQETYMIDPQSQPVQLMLTINELSATKLDVSYTRNGQLIREVYLIS